MGEAHRTWKTGSWGSRELGPDEEEEEEEVEPVG